MKRSGSHILLAVPTRGSIRWETVTRLEEIRDATPGLSPILYQPGNLSVALTRNTIVRHFLQGNWKTLIMVDDDIVPPPHFIETLDRELSGFGMVAIPHVMPINGETILTTYFLASDGYVPVRGLGSGLVEVDAVATGCVAISLSALEAVGPDPFRIAHNPTESVTSDDFLFCGKLQSHGFKIGAWLDDWHCDHVTTVSLAPLHERSVREYA